MKAKDRRLSELRSVIKEITPKEAQDLIKDNGASLIDVRDSDEVAQGSPRGALRLGRSFLELRVEDSVPNLEQPVIVMCAGGARSLFAAEALVGMGYKQVFSLAGGFNRWKNEGLGFEVPRFLDAKGKERYSRHLLMKEVGEQGQLKLLDSKVLLIGAGGLGSPSAYYLAAAGVGTIGLVDHDVVDRSNLQRQIIHTEDRIGMPKVESAKIAIEALNPDVKVKTYQHKLDVSNVEEIFSQYDVIVDGTDNLTARYLINDACVKLGLPNVHAAVYRFDGQITVFWPAYNKDKSGCYRCMFPEPPPPELAPSCAEAGVLGVMPGVFGLLQAVEVLKILLDVGEPLVGRQLTYDALGGEFYTMKLKPNPKCRYCRDGSVFPGYDEVAEVCASNLGGH
ncbi:MAG: molybdopterin-synthase adenylyltransferase MoeB [Gammaproteobacteria bacterium]|nr:molybdopterin-synthase adenylyltransferase MoeB [Gammaproteobacteria bacterium]